VVDGVEFCPKANGERANANPKASARDRSVFELIVIEFLDSLSSRWQTRNLVASNKFVEFDDELLIHVVCRVPANVF
jgi:hypothetical protein